MRALDLPMFFYGAAIGSSVFEGRGLPIGQLCFRNTKKCFKF